MATGLSSEHQQQDCAHHLQKEDSQDTESLDHGPSGSEDEATAALMLLSSATSDEETKNKEKKKRKRGSCRDNDRARPLDRSKSPEEGEEPRYDTRVHSLLIHTPPHNFDDKCVRAHLKRPRRRAFIVHTIYPA